MLKKAEYDIRNGKFQDGIESLIKCNCIREAFDIMIQNKQNDLILHNSKYLSKEQNKDQFLRCIDYFREHNNYLNAKEMALKISDKQILLEIYL